MNHQAYLIPIQQNRIKNNQVTGLHLMIGFLLITLGFVTWLIPPEIKTRQYLFLNGIGIAYFLFGLAIVTISIFFNKKVIQTTGNQVIRLFEIAFLSTIIIYALLKTWYLPASYSGAALLAVVFAFFWERKGKKSENVSISQSGITIPKFLKDKTLLWQEIKFVRLKHNVLTIDCRNNKLYQFTTAHLNNDQQHQISTFSAKQILQHEHLKETEW